MDKLSDELLEQLAVVNQLLDRSGEKNAQSIEYYKAQSELMSWLLERSLEIYTTLKRTEKLEEALQIMIASGGEASMIAQSVLGLVTINKKLVLEPQPLPDPDVPSLYLDTGLGPDKATIK